MEHVWECPAWKTAWDDAKEATAAFLESQATDPTLTAALLEVMAAMQRQRAPRHSPHSTTIAKAMQEQR